MRESLVRLFIDPLSQVYFQKALIGGCLVAVVAGVIGCLVILRKMSFLGDALSHAMIAGVAGGYLFMKLVFGIEAHTAAMLLGSVLAALLTVALIGFVSHVSRIKEDTAIGIMYTGVFSLGILVVSIFRNHIHIDLMHFIMGDILGISDGDLWSAGIVAALVLSVVLIFFRQLRMASFDPIMAAAIGLPVVILDYVLTTCVSLVVVSAVTMVGVILVVGLLITPAGTAYLLSDRLHRMMLLAALFGVTSVVGGLYLAVWLDTAGAGAVMIVATLQFLVVLLVAPRYGLIAGWLRRRNMVPQELAEDIITSLLRSGGQGVPFGSLLQHVHVERGNLVRAIRTLAKQGLLQKNDGTLSLTADGHKHATQVLRAHRIWEVYLQKVGGVATGELHPRAHNLEHLHEPDALDYLSERLGNPKLDPHGAVIPEGEKTKPDEQS